MNKPKGYVTIMAVLLVLSAGITIITTLLLLGATGAQTAVLRDRAGQTLSLANTCAQDGLELIRKNNSFTGTVNLTLAEGGCSYTITNLGGENRQVNATGTKGTVVRKVKVLVSAINPKVTVSSWQELGDF